MTTRRLSLVVWLLAVGGALAWWPLSHHYSAGFVATVPHGTGAGEAGFAVVSGMGKVVSYLSWSSRFSRRSAFFEPVLPHEFPHPWFGWQAEGGRLWISLPVPFLAALLIVTAIWHSRRRR